MLGFSPLSDSPLASLSSLVFYIRGSSDLIVALSSDSFGKLDIFGSQSNIISVTSSSVGYIKVTRRRKIIIAEAVRKSMIASQESKSSHVDTISKGVYAKSPPDSIIDL